MNNHIGIILQSKSNKDDMRCRGRTSKLTEMRPPRLKLTRVELVSMALRRYTEAPLLALWNKDVITPTSSTISSSNSTSSAIGNKTYNRFNFGGYVDEKA